MAVIAQALQQISVFSTVAQAAAQLQLETYVVGGWVRDLLLNRTEKLKDIDFVCVGDATTLAALLHEQYGAGKVSIFKKYGTAMVRMGDYELEFVGARKESYSPESRNPEVSTGTLADDQLRRDFTINALAISLNAHNYGELLDPFNGQKDLVRKVIRTPTDPYITFQDDPLRIMRAIRFAAQLKFDIEPDTFDAIIANVPRLDIISTERITTELNKIILSDKPSYGFKLLDAAGILQHIFPEFVLLKGAENVEGQSHKDNFYHTLEVLDNVAAMSNDLWLRWAAILHDIAKPATKRFTPKTGFTFHGHEDKGARMVPNIFQRFKLPLGPPMKMVQKLVLLHLRPIALVKDIVTDSAIRRIMVDAGEHLHELMTLCRADITTKNHHKAKRYIANMDKVEARMAEVEEKDHLRNFQPVITGEIIMQLFGLPAGREVGQLKEEIRQLILDGDVPNDMESALPVLVQLAAKRGHKPVSWQ